jgi:hypothetical protein
VGVRKVKYAEMNYVKHHRKLNLVLFFSTYDFGLLVFHSNT